MRDPEITMDTVRVALQLCRSAHCALWIEGVQNAAKLGLIAKRIKRLNEDDCNVPSDEQMQADRDRKRNALVAQGSMIAAIYAATFHPYGEGGGLWPYVKLSNGGTVTP